MASHGVSQTQQRVRSEEERQKELKKIEQYKTLENQVRDAIAASNFSEETLNLTSKLLKENPEYYTIWNYRRRVLLHLVTADETTIEPRLRADLEFLFPLLRGFPKCYWIWNHRMWLLAQASHRLPSKEAERFWQEELALIGKMLSRDNRNFHAWSYRRRVVRELEKIREAQEAAEEAGGEAATDGQPLCEKEYAYTTQMIRGNLSNFSAWHQRSILIPQILKHREASPEEREKLFDSELAFCKDAVFADPWDQSLWFYHSYLMTVLLGGCQENAKGVSFRGVKSVSRDFWVRFDSQAREKYLRTELEEINELLEDETVADCKWIYQSLLSLAQSYIEIEAGNQLSVISTRNLRQWLGQLETLDPLRTRRWNDWAKALDL